MAQEIELKFIVHPQALTRLQETLNQRGQEHQPARALTNTYYETADNVLRRHDMGLRVRGRDNHYEMTMKTAGRVIGGLHQRPEYNIALPDATLDLALFPADMWPEGMDIADLQHRVNPLFTTHFVRETWVITEGKSRIELALDCGDVTANGLSEPICELELELLTGDTCDLLALAGQLIELPGLRMGSLSKAARGYHLAQGGAEWAIKPLGVLKAPAKATVEQGLEAALSQSLNSWLYHEELWLRGNPLAQRAVLQAVISVRSVLALFGGIIPRKASTQLRDLLMAFEASLTPEALADELLFTVQAGAARFALTRFLVTRQWQQFVDEKARAKLAGSFKRYADIQLSRHAAELKALFQRPLGDSYADKLPRLTREIDAVRVLAGVYPEQQVQSWLENWQGLHHGIITRQPIEIEHYRNEAISQPPFWLHSGK